MNRIDATRPDSPLLAGYGPCPVGVRHRRFVDPDRIDVVASTDALRRGPRTLPVELWYPARADTVPGTTYHTVLRDGVTPVSFHGQAAREAAPSRDGPFPLVVISHGYPGNRFLMAHLAEALASRGYLVAAADHPQSTYDDQGPFGATLYHRPLDQRFLLASLADDPLAKADTAAVIGYSMGGYGALVLAGAGLAPGMEDHDFAPPHRCLAEHLTGRLPPAPAALRAVIAIGPWGMGRGLWDAAGLEGLRAPLMILAGSADATSDYAAMRRLAEGAVNTDRHLLTFLNAGHNAAAPIPAPSESHAHSDALGWAPFLHYADPVWDTLRMNALAQHFTAAFLDLHLKGDAARAPLIDPASAFDLGAGFTPESAVGLTLERWPA